MQLFCCTPSPTPPRQLYSCSGRRVDHNSIVQFGHSKLDKNSFPTSKRLTSIMQIELHRRLHHLRLCFWVVADSPFRQLMAIQIKSIPCRSIKGALPKVSCAVTFAGKHRFRPEIHSESSAGLPATTLTCHSSWTCWWDEQRRWKPP